MQDDLVAVTGEFVVVRAPLQPDVQTSDPVGEVSEEGRRDQQFLLQELGAVQLAGDRRPTGAVPEHRPGQFPVRVQVADVSHDDPAPGGEEVEQPVEHPGQVGPAREVLHHRVQDDRVEEPVRQSVELVGGLPAQHHAVAETSGLDVRAQPVHDGSGQVGAPVRLAATGQLGEQQPGPHTYFQHPAGVLLPDSFDGRGPPLPHLGERDGPAGVGTGPADEVLPERSRVGARGDGVVHRSPLGDLLDLGVRPFGRTPFLIPGGVDDQVSDQVALSGDVLPGDDHRSGDVGVRGQHGFRLAGLDPVPSNLDLRVGPAQEVQFAVRVPSDEVSGPVDPGPVRARDEAGGRQRRSAQVSPGDLRSPDVQLTGDSGGHRPQPIVQHDQGGAIHGPTDRHDVPPRRSGRVGGGDLDRRLRRAVEVDDATVPGRAGRLRQRRR